MVEDFVSDDAKDLISKLMTKKVEDRATFKDIFKHRWITSNEEKLLD